MSGRSPDQRICITGCEWEVRLRKHVPTDVSLEIQRLGKPIDMIPSLTKVCGGRCKRTKTVCKMTCLTVSRTQFYYGRLHQSCPNPDGCILGACGKQGKAVTFGHMQRLPAKAGHRLRMSLKGAQVFATLGTPHQNNLVHPSLSWKRPQLMERLGTGDCYKIKIFKWIDIVKLCKASRDLCTVTYAVHAHK